MFGGQRAARAIVPVFQAMPLLPQELVWVKDGLNYRHGAPGGAFAGFSPPRTAGFGLPASFGPLPAPHTLKRNWACRDQAASTRRASPWERIPNRRRSSGCSRQSRRERRTVEATTNPSLAQSSRGTSVGDRGAALVTAATTTSAMSSQSTSTGRSLEAMPLVKGISASQSSPALGIVVKPLVLRGVAVQKGAVVAKDKRRRFGLLSRPSATPGHPG